MLTVLMATYNGAATLPRMLDACCRLLPPAQPWQLVVVDNASTDDTPAILAGYLPRLPLQCLHEARRGKNFALNTALDSLTAPLATDDLLIFTDDDVIPDPDWLQQWERCAADHGAYAIFGGAILPDWSAPAPDWLLHHTPLGLTFGLTAPGLTDGPLYPGLVWGANMLLRRRLLAQGERFDTSVGPAEGDYAMGSETEMLRRLARAGNGAWHCSSARVAHHIRAHQLTPAYALQKARRFGRGKYRQDSPGQFPEWRGMPRWMLRQYLVHAGRWLLAILRSDGTARWRQRWELAYLQGYFLEAWRTRRSMPVTTPRVLVTSYSGELGGMELRMAQEVRYLQRSGYAATLALRPFDGLELWSQRLAAEQISLALFAPPLFFEQWSGRRRQRWCARWLAARRLRAFRADLVHVAFCWTHYGASILWLAAHCRVPAVISVHNAFPMTAISAWHAPLLHQAFSGVRGIYAVSASALSHFMAIYQPYIVAGTRLAVIPNPVDVERFQPSAEKRDAARQRWNLPTQALVIGAVGRLSEQKQPGAVIALFALLRRQFADLRLVLAGGGPLEAALRAQVARMGLGDSVLFTGYIDDMAALMPAFDLHILLSKNEGFGIATIEAMACGVPAIATDVPGSADVLAGSAGGMLVPVGDIGAALPVLAALLADPLRRRAMGLAGRNEAVARYSEPFVGRKVQDFYSGLLP
ncbi:MAG: glycosyltransferase [Duganella sp.]